jgi:hypothetical protein
MTATPATPAKPAHKIVAKITAPCPAKARDQVRLRIHLCCVLCGACILAALLELHLDDNGVVTAFGPIIPTAIQEILDFFKKLG